MKTDYPELENTEITYRASSSDRKAIIIGVNYHVGITIVEKDDPEHKLCCLNRKFHVFEKACFSKSDYRRRFQDIVKRLQAGVYDINEHHTLMGDDDRPVLGTPTLQCAFL